MKTAVKKWRLAFILKAGRCDLCRQDYGLSLHELGRARGVNRQSALMEPSCLMVLCLSNPATGRIGCHEKTQNRPELEQLALLYLNAPSRFDLKRYLEITSPRAPSRITWQEVSTAADSINERWKR